MSLTFVVGIGITAALLLGMAAFVNKQHWPLKLLNVLFAVICMIMIPFVITEYADNCDLVLTNSTIGYDGNSEHKSVNHTIHYTYDEICVTSTKQSPATFMVFTMYYLRIIILYIFISLFVWVFREHMINKALKTVQNWSRRMRK